MSAAHCSQEILHLDRVEVANIKSLDDTDPVKAAQLRKERYARIQEKRDLEKARELENERKEKEEKAAIRAAEVRHANESKPPGLSEGKEGGS